MSNWEKEFSEHFKSIELYDGGKTAPMAYYNPAEIRKFIKKAQAEAVKQTVENILQQPMFNRGGRLTPGQKVLKNYLISLAEQEKE